MGSKQIKEMPGGIVRRRFRESSRQHSKIYPVKVPESLRSSRFYSCLYEQTRSFDENSQTITLEVPDNYLIPGLPNGYYFKGGAARELLRAFLHSNPGKIHVRDFDIVRFMATADTHDHDLSMRFMLDDYEFGRGVEVVESRKVYFKTRDITQNEVLATRGSLEASVQSVLDISENVLRPSQFVKDKAGKVLEATVAKIFRFAAESQIAGRSYTIVDLDDRVDLSDFYLALNLDRSLASGASVAEEYLQLVWERTNNLVEFEVPPAVAVAIKHFSARITQGIRLFRNIPVEVLRDLGSDY